MNLSDVLISPRWQKVWWEVWGYKRRTALVVLSISLGVLAVGLASGAQAILARELPARYATAEPAHMSFTLSPFTDDLVETVRHVSGVRDAEGRRSMVARLQTRPDNWTNLYLFAIPNFDDIRVNKVEPVSGAWPPCDHEILIEQAAFSLTGARLQDELLVGLPDGTERRLRLSGLAHDLSQQPATFEGMIYGYINLDTLEWLGQSRTYNELYVTLKPPVRDQNQVRHLAVRVRDKVEESGQVVLATSVPQPGKPPLADTIQGVTLLLSVFGLLILTLSGSLVINTISALLAGQMRQIGVMKAIGGRTSQIAGLYLGIALIFGLLAVLIGAPLGLLAARWLAVFLAGFINYDVTDLSLPPDILALEVAIGWLVPLLAALYPVFSGTRVSVREALDDSRLGRDRFGTGWLDRWLQQIRRVSGPLMLSLYNTFRNKGRLAFTLTTLSLASAFFIAVISLYASTERSMEHVFRYWQADLMLNFSRPYHIDRLEREALRVPGVVDADPWHMVETNRVYPDHTKGDILFMYALLADTFSIQPQLLAGRWLRPEDKNAVVISNKFLDEEPGVRVGDEITLKVQGREVAWQVVGVVHMMLADGPTVYVNLPYFSRVAGLSGHVDGLYLQTVRHDPESQRQVMQAAEHHFASRGLQLKSVFELSDLQTMIQAIFEVIVTILLLMALLLSLVGGLGLMGTMSLNVLERTREIGVMRAIGATDLILLQVILGEAGLISVISWLLGCLLAFPLSKLLSDMVGLAVMQTPFIYTFSAVGALAWLVIVLLLAYVACLIPARQACRLTVREVLAYE